MTDKKKIELLREALQAASDHLDFCGYGDKWERECAAQSKLDRKIANALEKTASK